MADGSGEVAATSWPPLYALAVMMLVAASFVPLPVQASAAAVAGGAGGDAVSST